MSTLKALVDCLDRQPPWSDIAVIVLAGGAFNASSERPLTVLGPLRNVTILERPVRRLILTRTVAIALRGRARQLELRRYIEERADVLRREQLASQMKDEFLMNVSHELRTPLTAIYGWARMLVTGEIREDQKRRAIETIERNAQAQMQLVNDLLDVSRAISGKVGSTSAPSISLTSCSPRSTRCSPPRTPRAFACSRSWIRTPARSSATASACSRWRGTCCRTRSSSRRTADTSR